MIKTLTIPELAKATYPDELIGNYHRSIPFCRLRFMVRGWLYKQTIRDIQSSLSAPLLSGLMELNKQFFEKPLRPYVKAKGNVAERAAFLLNHYQFIDKKVTQDISKTVYQDHQDIELLSFELKEQQFKIALGFDYRLRREGALILKLLDENNNSFYTLTFIVNDTESKRTMIIGGIQGPHSSEENNVRIKILTRGLHGLRPKDLVIKLLRMLAKTWEVDQILAIRNNSHIYQAKRHTRSRVKANYDSHWETLNATPFSKEFVELDVKDTLKPIEEVSQSKRTMYRRRYEWLEMMQQVIDQRLPLLKA